MNYIIKFFLFSISFCLSLSVTASYKAISPCDIYVPNTKNQPPIVVKNFEEALSILCAHGEAYNDWENNYRQYRSGELGSEITLGLTTFLTALFGSHAYKSLISHNSVLPTTTVIKHPIRGAAFLTASILSAIAMIASSVSIPFSRAGETAAKEIIDLYRMNIAPADFSELQQISYKMANDLVDQYCSKSNTADQLNQDYSNIFADTFNCLSYNIVFEMR